LGNAFHPTLQSLLIGEIEMKVTPHTIFIYSSGHFLRIVRGEHPLSDTIIKPRVYANLAEALAHERKPRIRSVLECFPPDKLIERRLKSKKAPVKIERHRTLVDAVKSKLYLYTQAGYDVHHKEVAYVYHRNPSGSTGLALAGKGSVDTVRKLLKRYKKPPMRGLHYQEEKKAKSTTTAVA
jgi:hypothetical protein